MHPVHRGLVLDGLPRVGDQHLGAGPVVRRRGVAQFGEAALDLVSHRIEFIACIDLLAQLFVLAAVRLGLGEHPLDLALIEVGLSR